jgi:hypothetical protein
MNKDTKEGEKRTYGGKKKRTKEKEKNQGKKIVRMKADHK